MAVDKQLDFSTALRRFLDAVAEEPLYNVEPVKRRACSRDQICFEDARGEAIERAKRVLLRNGMKLADAVWLACRANQQCIAQALADKFISSNSTGASLDAIFVESDIFENIVHKELFAYCKQHSNELTKCHASWVSRCAPQVPTFEVVSFKNQRRRNEDFYSVIPELHDMTPDQQCNENPISFFAVFDGHGGCESACYAATHLASNLNALNSSDSNIRESLLEAFRITEERLLKKCKRQHLRSGCTALTCLVSSSAIYTAWVGDSLAIILDANGSVQFLNQPHCLVDEEERDRVQQEGGTILDVQGEERVNGWISVTRSLGDIQLKPPLSAEPGYNMVRRCPHHCLLLLGTDGFWDGISPKTCHQLVRLFYASGRDKEGEDLCGVLAEHAISNGGSTDNLTLIVIYLQDKSSVADLFHSQDPEL
ncbi:protein phosphatase 2C [Trichuris trichiura]|uniref:Protein phosphatase 2C n=1 Tax=Trichuris trichiura TaxID=36087 RepID=A0A077ZBJ3_TRITR|nr:protein phosphatase 2C [Trichuris trichiura]